MIKAVLRTPHGQPLIVLGLSALNIERLTDDQPIFVELSDLGMGNGGILLVAGTDERAIVQNLEDGNLVPAGSAGNLGDAVPGETVRLHF